MLQYIVCEYRFYANFHPLHKFSRIGCWLRVTRSLRAFSHSNCKNSTATIDTRQEFLSDNKEGSMRDNNQGMFRISTISTLTLSGDPYFPLQTKALICSCRIMCTTFVILSSGENMGKYVWKLLFFKELIRWVGFNNFGIFYSMMIIISILCSCYFQTKLQGGTGYVLKVFSAMFPSSILET